MMIRNVLLGCLLLLSQAATATATADQSPLDLIRDTSEYVLSQVKARKAELEKDTSGIYELVDERVIPHFDFRLMTRAAAGKHWRRASEEQRNRLTREFQEMLVRTYATILLSYSDEKVEYLPFRGKPEDKRVTVHTKVHAGGGAPPIPINYRLIRKEGRWKIYDVVADGVSLVSNYRNTFTTEVRKGGIEGLIDTLAQHNRKLRNG